jgi:hypothetical protein
LTINDKKNVITRYDMKLVLNSIQRQIVKNHDNTFNKNFGTFGLETYTKLFS